MVGVKILMRYGHFLTVGMNNKEAERLFNQFAIRAERRNYSGTCEITGITWMIDLSDVIGVHTFDAEPMRQEHLRAQQALTKGQWWGKGSGLG